MKTSELRGKGEGELKDIILASKKEQFNLRMQTATGEQPNGGRVRELRRTIARAKTLMGQQAGGAAVPAKKPAKPATKKAKKG